MSKLFAWDEIGDELEERDADELRALNEEGGWQYQETLPNGVAVLSTDRHYALEVHAATKEEAHQKMMAFDYYERWHKED